MSNDVNDGVRSGGEVIFAGQEEKPKRKTGYLQWHAWAEAQHKSGLRQTQCHTCAKWLYPQEIEGHVCEKGAP